MIKNAMLLVLCSHYRHTSSTQIGRRESVMSKLKRGRCWSGSYLLSIKLNSHGPYAAEFQKQKFRSANYKFTRSNCPRVLKSGQFHYSNLYVEVNKTPIREEFFRRRDTYRVSLWNIFTLTCSAREHFRTYNNRSDTMRSGIILSHSSAMASRLPTTFMNRRTEEQRVDLR